MKDEAFVRQEIIDGADLNPADLRCPKCKGNTLVLSGQAQVPQREIWENGVVVAMHSTPEQGGSFDIERMDCVPCQRTYFVRNPRVFELERENLDLQNQNNLLRQELVERGGNPGGDQGAGLGYIN